MQITFKNHYSTSNQKYFKSDAKSHKDKTFAGCTSLKELSIPNSVTHIGIEAFSGCKLLEKMILPGSIQNYGSKAFYECELLEDDSLKKLPNYTTVRKDSFEKCSKISAECFNHNEMDDGEFSVLIIDNGSYMIKAGFQGDEAPCRVFPSKIGRHKYKSIVTGRENKYIYIGDEACAKASVLNLKNVIEKGVITDFKDMKKIWNHTFYNELIQNPFKYCIFLTDKQFTKIEHREKIAEIMFEKFNVPSFFIASENYLSLLASGGTTGISLNIGDSVCSCSAIYEGYYCPNALTVNNDIAGRNLTEWLRKLYLMKVVIILQLHLKKK